MHASGAVADPVKNFIVPISYESLSGQTFNGRKLGDTARPGYPNDLTFEIVQVADFLGTHQRINDIGLKASGDDNRSAESDRPSGWNSCNLHVIHIAADQSGHGCRPALNEHRLHVQIFRRKKS